jgi:hypothetical protein
MGSAWVNPLIDDIWDGLWHRGLQHSCVAPCCAPFPSAENLGEAETFTLQVDFIGADPSHRPSLHLQIGPEKPALPESLAVPRREMDGSHGFGSDLPPPWICLGWGTW